MALLSIPVIGPPEPLSSWTKSQSDQVGGALNRVMRAQRRIERELKLPIARQHWVCDFHRRRNNNDNRSSLKASGISDLDLLLAGVVEAVAGHGGDGVLAGRQV